MKIKKILKTGVAISSIGMAAAPMAVLVSCGNSENKDLLIGIRPEDQTFWKNVQKQFEKATGKSIGFKWVSNQKQSYPLWSGQDVMPDVTLADATWSGTGIERGWFKHIDLKDIAENPKYMISGQDDKYKEKNLKFNRENFEMPMMDAMKTSNDGYNAFAVGYGAKMTYSWKNIPKKDGSLFNIYDGNKKLEWYVPNVNGSLDQVKAFHNAPSPLFSVHDGHRLKNTVEDIQEFLSNAANVKNLNFNQSTYDKDTPNKQKPEDRVISTGDLGYQQRLGSVGKLMKDYLDTKNDLKFKPLVGASVVADLEVTPFAYGDKLLKTTQGDVDNAQMNVNEFRALNENSVLSNGRDGQNVKWDFDSRNNVTASKYSSLLWLGHYGYYNDGAMGTPGATKEKGQAKFSEVDNLAAGRAMMITNGALWQWAGIKDKLESLHKGFKVDNLLTSFGEPIQNTGVDGYALNKNISAEKETLAKKFIRFLMQPQASADIASTKIISNIKDAQKLQPELKGARRTGLMGAGVKNVEGVIKNVDFTLTSVVSSHDNLNGTNNSPVFPPYTVIYGTGSEFDKTQTSFQDYHKAIGIYNGKYKDSLIGLN